MIDGEAASVMLKNILEPRLYVPRNAENNIFVSEISEQ